MKFIKKYWLIIILSLLTIVRFLLSYKLPSFFLGNLRIDDRLSIVQLDYLSSGNYLGLVYNDITLIKGFMYSLIITISFLIKMSFSTMLTIIYILSSVYFSFSLKKIVKNKYILSFIYILILFNPLSYSSDLFQRIYRNGLTLSLMLLFLGSLFRIIKDDKNKKFNYIIFGIIISIMFLTREDNIWVYIVLLILLVYKIYKKKSFKTLLTCAIPLIILIINLNIVSYINYKYYGIYTYNELQKSEFKKAYKKILEIKDDKKIHQVAIPRSTLEKVAENVKSINLTKKDIESRYNLSANEIGEIYNGSIVWQFRNMIFNKNQFKSGKESEEFYKKVKEEIEELFNKGVLEKEITSPSIFINLPTREEILEYPKDIIKTIVYTSTYKNVKTFSEERLKNKDKSVEDTYHHAYMVMYGDYHNAENLIEENIWYIEVIRILYKWFTIIFSIISLIIYIKNIKVKDKLNLLLHITLIIYLIILLGVSYTHTTSYPSIRYFYLASIYLLQSIFISLNIYRFYQNKTNK